MNEPEPVSNPPTKPKRIFFFFFKSFTWGMLSPAQIMKDDVIFLLTEIKCLQN